jgi:hypothetical protein
MENWRVFKETPWRYGRPDRRGGYHAMEIGTTKWLVSDLGNIKREHYLPDGTLKSSFDVVQHWKGRKDATHKLLGIPTGEYVNRIVATQWVPNPEGYKYLEYIDGDKSNNSAVNLRWCLKPCRVNYPVKPKKEKI